MAAKTWPKAGSGSGVDELFFHNSTVSLCLLVNRRQRTARIIDFRAGPTPAKRNFVLAAAKREGVEKVFTLVERDEVSTWTRLGFVREGSIPSFYKRSDAWVLGAVVSQVGPMLAEAAAASRDDNGDDDEPDEASDAPPNPAIALAERTVQKAKRLLKSPADKPLPAVKIAISGEAEVRKALAAAERGGRALTGFEPFGRDVQRTSFVLTARGGFELHASVEVQPCFGNSFLELLTSPASDAERFATTSALRVLCERLQRDGAVSTFLLAPADDVLLAAACLANGFRRSAVLARHLLVRGERKDAMLWSRKLAASVDG